MAQCYVRLNAELGNEQTSAFGPGVLPPFEDGTRRGCADVPGADGTPLEPVGPHGIYDPAQHAPRTLCEAFTYKSEAETLEVRVGVGVGVGEGGGLAYHTPPPHKAAP